jgi:hypothetical protein
VVLAGALGVEVRVAEVSTYQTGRGPVSSPDHGGHLHWLDKDMPNRDRPA